MCVALVFLAPGTSGLPWATVALFFFYALVTGLLWAIIEFSLGWVLRPAFALLFAVALPYAWYAVTPAFSLSGPLGRLRLLTGDLTGCCSPDAVVDTRALMTAAVGATALAGVVVGCGLAALQRRPQLTTAAVLVGATIWGSCAWLLSAGVDATGGKARAAQELECIDSVCVWPEVPDTNRTLNVQARQEFQRIAPAELGQVSRSQVVWQPTSEDQLIFSGADTVEGVLGDFVDQTALGYLSGTGQTVCGMDPRGFGSVRTMQPWPSAQSITPEAVQTRLQGYLCPNEESGINAAMTPSDQR